MPYRHGGGERSARGFLTIRSQLHEHDTILVEVEDSGIGLDPTSIDQFSRAMFTTKPDGMGMGLSISRSSFAAHGGRLWASPSDRVGAIFCIILPTDVSGNGIAG